MRRTLAPLALAFALLSSPSAALAADPPPGSDKPLQTRPVKVDDSVLLLGWAANIVGIGGEGKTLLVIDGEDGYVTTIDVDGQSIQKTHPATFELGNKDYRILVKVRDARGAEWSETVDVPKGMKVTVEIRARYEHRGFEGTIKNDTLGCKSKTQRRFLKIEIIDADGKEVGKPITLEPGKSAPGVRLKPGVYDLKISERKGLGYVDFKTAKFEPKESQWRFDVGCE
jgi:hypothetical protein